MLFSQSELAAVDDAEKQQQNVAVLSTAIDRRTGEFDVVSEANDQIIHRLQCSRPCVNVFYEEVYCLGSNYFP